jgi:hypothetical protein
MIRRGKIELFFVVFLILFIAVPFNQDTFTTALPAPTYISPADGSYTNDNTTTWIWSSVTGATSYDLEYSFNSGFLGSMTRNILAPETSYTLPDPGFNIDRTYYWRVAANGPGDPGNLEDSPVWSYTLDTVNPDQPSLLSPGDGTFTNDNTPLFDWGDAAGAYEYRIVVDDDIGFGSPIIDDTTLISEYQALTTFSETTYVWRVQARDQANNYGLWSDTDAFIVDITPPGSLSLISPANETVTATQPTLECSTTTGADIYYFEIGNNPAFDTVYYSGGTASTTYTTSLSDGKYYWHVQPRDLAGNQGPWSETRLFTLDTIGPSAPTLFLPINYTFTSELKPTLYWNDTEDGVEWRIEVDLTEDFLAPDIYTSGTQDYLFLIDLDEGRRYWRVQARDSLGNWGAFSEIWTFMIDLTVPSGPTLIKPSNDTFTNNDIITFQWISLVDTIDWYRIYVSQYADFSDIYYSPYVEDSDNNFTAAVPFTEGTFYWKIRAVDLAGNVGNWSETWIFTLDLTGPTPPELSSPNEGEVLNENIPTLVWVPVSDAVEYWLMIDNVNDWMLPEVNITTTSTSFTISSPLADGYYYWRVKARDEYGNWGNWSSVRIFGIDTIQIPEYNSQIPILIITSSIVLLAVVLLKREKGKE